MLRIHLIFFFENEIIHLECTSLLKANKDARMQTKGKIKYHENVWSSVGIAHKEDT